MDATAAILTHKAGRGISALLGIMADTMETGTGNNRIARYIRIAAILDLLVTWPLVIQPAAECYLHIAYMLNAQLPGTTAALPHLPVLAWLFVNLTGALAVLWALVRLLHSKPALGTADALARLWVATLFACYIVFGGLPPIFWAFVGTELLGTFIQIPVLQLSLRTRQRTRSRKRTP